MSPTEELGDLLDEQESRLSGTALVIRQVQDAISEYGRDIDFAVASLEERASIIEAVEMLKAFELAARARRQVIEHEIVQAAMKLDAKELRTADGTVRIESPNPGYNTKDVALRQALMQLVPLGDLTKAEVDDAVPETISAKADHRKLNGLRKRGGRVQEAIDTNRERRAMDMAQARVRVHRKGGLK